MSWKKIGAYFLVGKKGSNISRQYRKIINFNGRHREEVMLSQKLSEGRIHTSIITDIIAVEILDNKKIPCSLGN